MKRYLTIVFAFAMVLALIGCSNESPSVKSNEEKIEVSFGFTGEADSIIQTPLQARSARALDEGDTISTKAKDWYAIQVYDSNRTPYAYGFFDNIEDMKLLCIKDDTYSFVVDMVPEAEGQVHCFSLVQSGWTSIGNSFYYSKTESIRYLGNGYLYMESPLCDTFNRPSVDRFYGCLDGYKATLNGKVSIKLSRSAFSAKFVAKNFTEGTLEISLDNAPTFYLKVEDGNEFEHFYSFYDLTSSSEEIGVSIIWVNGDGKRIPLVAQNVNFARNTLTTLEFTVKETETSNTFSIAANEELETGDTINLDTIDGLVDTEVETTE